MSTERTLLISDVVDSTKIAQQLGDAAMAKHWAAHDRAARDLLQVWNGHEIDKTDGVLLMFENTANAVAYALAYHRAFATLALPFRARVGIHCGTVQLRVNSAADVALGAKPIDIDGIATPITARVMGVARAGQTLLTQAAHGQLGATALRAQSHGHWRLKGIQEPVELFEVGDDQSPFIPPPDAPKAYRVVRQDDLWLPVRDVPHSIPAERDSFVGRQDALLALSRKFEAGARLVSVLGMGGSGKTRLATRFASTWLGEFPGGVWFCELSQARTLNDIYLAIAQGLEMRLAKADAALELAEAIQARGPCLLILDNCEQVARFANDTLGKLLGLAPQARFVVTTREVLGVQGEEILALPPLASAEGVDLFLRRAEAASHGFSPTADDRDAIAQLVHTLDGLPLAIELAAARVRVMAPRALLARMSERFSVLRSNTGRQDRQATLRATFDWSWEMLSPSEKAALAQLSVFVGGFTLQSAEGVLNLSSAPDAAWTVDAVSGLLDKSFLRRVDHGRIDMLDFDMLESVREYAAEHLRTPLRYEGSGPEAETAATSRHWHYFAGLDEQSAIAGSCADNLNLVTACQRATAHGDYANAVRCLLGAWYTILLTGPFQLGTSLSQALHGETALDDAQRSEVEWVLGCAQELMGQVDPARQHFDSGLQLAYKSLNRAGEVRLRISIALEQAAIGLHSESQANLSTALELTRALKNQSLECQALLALGNSALHHSKLDTAQNFYEAALALARRLGNRRMEGGLLGNIGGLLYRRGLLTEACGHYEQAMTIAHAMSDRQWEGNARCNLGLMRFEMGLHAEARAQLEPALALALELGHARLQATVLCNLGLVLDALGEREAAQSQLLQAVTVAHDLGNQRLEGQFRSYLALVDARMGNFQDARTCLSVGEALLIAASDQLSLALLYCFQAESEHLAGNPVAAGAALRRADALSVANAASSESELGRAILYTKSLVEPDIEERR